MPNAPDLSNRGRKGFLRGNRSLIILLVDIALICVLAIAYRVFFYHPPYAGELSGYSLTLRGMSLKDRIIASVWVDRASREESVPPETGLERVFVRFWVEEEEEEVRISEKLPLAQGNSVELTATIFVRDAVRRKMLRAEIQIGEKKTVLERQLESNRD